MPKFKYANNLKRNRGGPYKTAPATDLSRWRLKNVEGRQTWHYLDTSDAQKKPQSLLEKHSIGLTTVCEASGYLFKLAHSQDWLVKLSNGKLFDIPVILLLHFILYTLADVMLYLLRLDRFDWPLYSNYN